MNTSLKKLSPLRQKQIYLDPHQEKKDIEIF
jgi:hypothetical protein